MELHSDQGRNSDSNVFREVCSLLGINKTHMTPLLPHSDGMVERTNRTLDTFRDTAQRPGLRRRGRSRNLYTSPAQQNQGNDNYASLARDNNDPKMSCMLWALLEGSN